MDVNIAESWTAIVSGSMAVGVALWTWALKPLVTKIARWISVFRQMMVLGPILQDIQAEFTGGEKASLPQILSIVEKELIFSHNRYRMLVQALNVAVFEAGADGKFLWVSDEWCEITDMLPHEAFGNGWINGIDNEDRKAVFDEWALSVSQCRESVSSIFRVGKHKHPVYWHTYPIVDAAKNVIGFVGVLHRYENVTTST